MSAVIAGLELTLLVMDWLDAAVKVGMNFSDAFGRVSKLLKERHAAGETVTKEDLAALYNVGDSLEAEALKQFDATLADPNTPVV